MAGQPGNVGWTSLEPQSARGTPLTPPTFKAPFTDGSLGPRKETDTLEETDADRDQGDTYAVVGGAEGTPEVYGRDSYAHKILHGALGAKATTGAGPDYTHTLTPANLLPYLTAVRQTGTLLWEQIEDAKVHELEVNAEAGQPLTFAYELRGRNATRLTADPAPGVSVANDAVYNFNEVAVTLGGAATSLVSTFNLTYTNNVEYQQTDDFKPYDVVEGTREVTVGFDMLFESLDHYNEFHYGGTAGTVQSADNYVVDLEFEFSKGASNSITFTLPRVAIEEFPIEPDASGDPIVIAARARATRGVTPVLTAEVKNQVAA